VRLGKTQGCCGNTRECNTETHPHCQCYPSRCSQQLAALNGIYRITESRVSDPDMAPPFQHAARDLPENPKKLLENSRSYQDIGVHRPAWQNVSDVSGKRLPRSSSRGASVAVNSSYGSRNSCRPPAGEVFATLPGYFTPVRGHVKRIRVSSTKRDDLSLLGG